jgi:hypothetical protein
MPTPEELAAAEKAKADEAKAAAEKAAAAAQEQKDEFDLWLEKQPKNVQDAYANKTNGLVSALQKEREASKSNKDALKKLADFEKAEEERKKASMSETERLQTQLAEEQKARLAAETVAQTARTENGISAIAGGKFTDLKGDVLPQLDFSAIEFDANGNPTKESVQPQLDKLAKEKPYLLSGRKTAPAGNVMNPGSNASQSGETDAERRKRLGI